MFMLCSDEGNTKVKSDAEWRIGVECMIQGEHGTEGKEQVPVLYKDPYGTAAQDGAHRKLTTVYNYE